MQHVRLYLFLVAIDWIMRKSKADRYDGNFTTNLEDLNYSDDIALLSNTKEQLQRKVNDVNKHAH